VAHSCKPGSFPRRCSAAGSFPAFVRSLAAHGQCASGGIERFGLGPSAGKWPHVFGHEIYFHCLIQIIISLILRGIHVGGPPSACHTNCNWPSSPSSYRNASIQCSIKFGAGGRRHGQCSFIPLDKIKFVCFRFALATASSRGGVRSACFTSCIQAEIVNCCGSGFWVLLPVVMVQKSHVFQHGQTSPNKLRTISLISVGAQVP